ncbi:MAG: tyrosine--tRNA ligase [Firmicutes bacterium]|nr:tyrosine--tRNA ligase [Bacillota bacterium]
MNAFKILESRGFLEQSTNFDELEKKFASEKIVFYTGFDPTADSLTVGHFIPIMAMSHLQRAGHTPIFLIGGGTATIGDPTDRTEMRRIMTREEIEHNANCFKEQLKNIIDFDNAIIVNNADWLLKLNYVDFIRTYGIYFSVNKMLTAEAYKTRFARGLSFYEFNYMLMQAYDFLELYRSYNCTVQFGGNDQWSNILAGVDLIRRVENKTVYGLTFKLLTKSDGQKMGKSVSGAIWLDKNKTTPYEFFQYWRNIDDKDVEKCLKLLTFIDLEDIDKLLSGDINLAKEKLAYETTKLIHGKDEADKALQAAKTLFGGKNFIDSVPVIEIEKDIFVDNSEINICDLLLKINLVPSKSEARRIISQGGLKIDNNKILDINYSVGEDSFDDNGCILIQKGKKIFYRVKLK